MLQRQAEDRRRARRTQVAKEKCAKIGQPLSVLVQDVPNYLPITDTVMTLLISPGLNVNTSDVVV
jgi:hypothetical protein